MAIIELGKAVKHCEDIGLRFAACDDTVVAIRTDLLEDLTDNLVPRKGQEAITECMYHVIENVLDASCGLYANVKE